jgi:hypothetical protein
VKVGTDVSSIILLAHPARTRFEITDSRVQYDFPPNVRRWDVHDVLVPIKDQFNTLLPISILYLDVGG